MSAEATPVRACACRSRDLALVLGAVGIYGVMSYIVSQRRAEIGLRLALGAEPRSVVRMIVRQGGLVTIGGIIVGLTAALVGSRLLGSLLYEVSARDPGVFAATTLALLGIAFMLAAGAPRLSSEPARCLAGGLTRVVLHDLLRPCNGVQTAALVSFAESRPIRRRDATPRDGHPPRAGILGPRFVTLRFCRGHVLLHAVRDALDWNQRVGPKMWPL